jgi:RNA recognition motif-containing protein
MNGKEQQRSASAQPKSKPEFKKKASQDLKTATQVQPLPTIPTKQKPEKAPEIAIVKTAEAMQEEPLTKEASKPESNERKGRIFLKNLVYDTNEKMLRKLCTPFGEIKEINIPVDPSTNRPRGFAFVEFASKNSALKAVGSLNDSNWKGRKLTADLSVDKRRYEAASTTQPAIQPLSTAPATGDQIEVVPSKPALDEKPSKAKKEKKVVPKEETEDPEMDELDQIVLRNIAAMGNEFEFDEEEESENKEEEVHDDNGEPKASMHEVDVKGEISKSKIKTKLVENVDDLLKAAEKEKQKEVKKKHEEEDLSQTCFIRGVSFDIREEELLDFFRKNVGQIHYLKLVKFKADANKHNGNGFVKFKDPKVMQRLLEMTEQFNKGEYVPKPKDPKMEVGGIRLQFYPALKKTEAQDLKVKREQELAAKNEPEDKKKRHNKQKTMEELIAADKSGKRRLVFSKIGFFENIEESKLSEADLSQRKNHREEKKAKMQNPNYFVSDKRVLLKNIDRLLTDLQIKSLATEVLKSKLTPKEIKKAKIFSDVKLIESRSEESTGKSSVVIALPRALPSLSFTSQNMQMLSSARYQSPLLPDGSTTRGGRSSSLLSKMFASTKRSTRSKRSLRQTRKVIEK